MTNTTAPLDIFAITCSCPGVSAKILSAMRKAGWQDIYSIPIYSKHQDVVTKLTPYARVSSSSPLADVLARVKKSPLAKFSYIVIIDPSLPEKRTTVIDVNSLSVLELTAVLEAMWHKLNP